MNFLNKYPEFYQNFKDWSSFKTGRIPARLKMFQIAAAVGGGGLGIVVTFFIYKGMYDYFTAGRLQDFGVYIPFLCVSIAVLSAAIYAHFFEVFKNKKYQSLFNRFFENAQFKKDFISALSQEQLIERYAKNSNQTIFMFSEQRLEAQLQHNGYTLMEKFVALQHQLDNQEKGEQLLNPNSLTSLNSSTSNTASTSNTSSASKYLYSK